jgi:hypothetical protein
LEYPNVIARKIGISERDREEKVEYPMLQPRSGGRGKPGTAVPGRQGRENESASADGTRFLISSSGHEGAAGAYRITQSAISQLFTSFYPRLTPNSACLTILFMRLSSEKAPGDCGEVETA